MSCIKKCEVCGAINNDCGSDICCVCGNELTDSCDVRLSEDDAQPVDCE